MNPAEPQVGKQDQTHDGDVLQLSDGELEQIWQGINPQLSHPQKEVRNQLRKRLENLKRYGQAQYLVGKAVKIDALKGNMDGIAQELMVKITPMANAIAAIQLLGKVVDCGNAHGIFSLCPPPLAVHNKREPSPFIEEHVPMFSIAPTLRSYFKTESVIVNRLSNFHKAQQEKANAEMGSGSIVRKKSSHRKPGEPLPVLQKDHAMDSVVLGRFLLSSIVHGGLVHVSLLDQLVMMLLNGETLLQSAGDRLYVELSVSYRGQPDAEFRRWFIDPLSAVYAMGLQRDQVLSGLGGKYGSSMDMGQRRKALGRCIGLFIHAVTDSIAATPTLNTVLEATQLDFSTRMPMMLVNYASRRFVSHSLKPGAWRRLQGQPVDQDFVPVQKGVVKEADGEESISVGDEANLTDIEPRWLTRLREALKSPNRDGAILQTQELLSRQEIGFEPNEAGSLFAEFAVWLLQELKDRKPRFASSTIKDYVISASKRLGGLMGSNSLNAIDDGAWGILVEEALDDVETAGMRTKLVRVLRVFVQFLKTEKGIEGGQAMEALGHPGGLVPVDANMISEAEYQAILAEFAPVDPQTLPGQLVNEASRVRRTIGRLILMLSFRCGLRRSEVLLLDLIDVFLEDPAEMLIRPTAARTLKTINATRKIPLYAQIKPEELAELRAWLSRRLAEEGKSAFSRHLFANLPANQKMIPEDLFFSELHDAMRRVTKDPGIRFHHLRHSCASLTNLALMASQIKRSEQLNVTIPGSASELALGGELRQKLYRNTNMTRRDLWAITTLLGHSGPEMSLEHYIHTMDMGLAWAVDQEDIAPRLDTVMAAANRNLSTGYRNRYKGGLHAWVASIWDKQSNQAATTKTLSSEPIEENDSGTVMEQEFQTAWQCLYLYETKGLTIHELEGISGIDSSSLSWFMRNARALCEQFMPNSQTSYRHRFLEVEEIGMPKRRIICPSPLSKNGEKEILKDLSAKLNRVIATDKNLSRKVLEYFVEHAHPKLSGFHFENPDQPQDAIDCLKWLQALGLGMEELRIQSFDAASIDSMAMVKWQNALQLDSDQIAQSRPPIGRKDWVCPWLEITPVFGKKGPKKSSAAFRYFMVMAYILNY